MGQYVRETETRTRSTHAMHNLKRISWAMTAIGVAVIVLSLSIDLDPMWLLSGVLLAWAGIVKIVVTLIWTRVAQVGTDEHRPTPSP
jgi:hypothetical protein